MTADSTLNEQLAILGVHLPPCPEESEDDEPGNWIQRGQSYAEGIRLCRAQLQTAAAIGGLDNLRLASTVQNIGESSAWLQRMVRYMLSDLKGTGNLGWVNAAAELAANDDTTGAQRLGIALELARAGFLRLSIQTIQNIVETRQPSAKECLELCALLVENLATESGARGQICNESLESWQQSVSLHLEATSAISSAIRTASGTQNRTKLSSQLETLLQAAASNGTQIWNRWESVRFQASETLQTGEAEKARNAVYDWLTSPWGITPEGIDGNTYTELLLNACSTGNPLQPQRWLIESRSLPRSGHHFLKGLLKHAWGEDFSYCEGYQEPGCCKNSPCTISCYWHFARNNQKRHLRMVKSHDYALTDSTFDPPPGMIRFIQVRRPFDLLTSWIELAQLQMNKALLKDANISLERIYLYHEREVLEEAWRVIDEHGIIMNAGQLQVWLTDKVNYIVDFLQKWLPLTNLYRADQFFPGGNILLRYEDLGRSDELLKALGCKDLDSDQLPIFSPRHPQVLKRRSTLVTELIEASQTSLMQADADVIAAVPGMACLYPDSLPGVF